jgi:hypothetical protein
MERDRVRNPCDARLARQAEGGQRVSTPPHDPLPHTAGPGPVALPEPRGATDDRGPADRPVAAPDPAAVGCIGPAWIVREVTHVPGVLRLAHGRLCFTSSRGPVFDVDLATVTAGPEADLALDRRGRGFRITVGGERLAVHVVRPLGAVDPGSDFAHAVAEAADLPATVGDLAASDVWRAALLSASGGRRRRSTGRFAGRARRGSAGSAPRT